MLCRWYCCCCRCCCGFCHVFFHAIITGRLSIITTLASEMQASSVQCMLRRHTGGIVWAERAHIIADHIVFMHARRFCRGISFTRPIHSVALFLL